MSRLAISKIITQPARDFPDTFPEDPLKVLTSGTSRVPSGDSKGTSQRIDNLMKKCFLDVIFLVLHICYGFILVKQISKSSICTQLRDVPETRWWDVLGTSRGCRSHIFFKFNSEICFTCFDRLLETLWWIVVAKNLTWGSVVKFLF